MDRHGSSWRWWAWRSCGGPGRGSGPDIQQILARAPSVTLKDLQKGNMVIVVATQGQSPHSNCHHGCRRRRADAPSLYQRKPGHAFFSMESGWRGRRRWRGGKHRSRNFPRGFHNDSRAINPLRRTLEPLAGFLPDHSVLFYVYAALTICPGADFNRSPARPGGRPQRGCDSAGFAYRDIDCRGEPHGHIGRLWAIRDIRSRARANIRSRCKPQASPLLRPHLWESRPGKPSS